MSNPLVRELRFFGHAVVGPLLGRIGRHTPATGKGLEAWARGCGFARRPGSARPYRGNVRDASEIKVSAVNEQHARSLAIHDPGPGRVTPDGKTLGQDRIHPDNMLSVEPVSGLTA